MLFRAITFVDVAARGVGQRGEGGEQRTIATLVDLHRERTGARACREVRIGDERQFNRTALFERREPSPERKVRSVFRGRDGDHALVDDHVDAREVRAPVPSHDAAKDRPGKTAHCIGDNGAVLHRQRRGQRMPCPPAVDEVELVPSRRVQRRAIDRVAKVILAISEERVERPDYLMADHLPEGCNDAVVAGA
jgi:hypothetical protein